MVHAHLRLLVCLLLLVSASVAPIALLLPCQFILTFKDLSFLPSDAPPVLSYINAVPPASEDGDGAGLPSAAAAKYTWDQGSMVWVPYFLNYGAVKGTPLLMGIIGG